MKRPLKIYGWAWVAIIAATIVTFAVMIIYPSHHELAADPYSIEKIVKVDLPDIASVQTRDDLGGSSWDMFVHQGRFTEEISEESIQKMDELCLSVCLVCINGSIYDTYHMGHDPAHCQPFRRNPKKS